MTIRDSRDELHFPAKIKLLSSQIKTNMLINNINEIKISTCDKDIHKAMQIPVEID